MLSGGVSMDFQLVEKPSPSLLAAIIPYIDTAFRPSCIIATNRHRERVRGKTTTHNLLRAHYTKLDFPNLPDGRGGIWERERHGGEAFSGQSL